MSNHFSSTKLKEFRIILETKLKATTKELETLKYNQKSQKQHLANSNVDFNESSKHFQQLAKNKRLIKNLQRRLRELKSALNRIQDKTYGVCSRTGKLIREERLKAMPTARFDILKK